MVVLKVWSEIHVEGTNARHKINLDQYFTQHLNFLHLNCFSGFSVSINIKSGKAKPIIFSIKLLSVSLHNIVHNLHLTILCKF